MMKPLELAPKPASSVVRIRQATLQDTGFVHHSDRQVGPYPVPRYELDVR
jgi:hypothetical protein